MSGIEEKPLVLKVDEIVEPLRMSRGLVYQRLSVNGGEIPSIRVGGRIVIPRARFEAWLAGEDRPPV